MAQTQLEKTYRLVGTKPTKERAERLLKNVKDQTPFVTAKTVQTDKGYSVWVKPTSLGSVYLGTVGSKEFASWVKLASYGPTGEVF